MAALLPSVTNAGICGTPPGAALSVDVYHALLGMLLVVHAYLAAFPTEGPLFVTALVRAAPADHVHHTALSMLSAVHTDPAVHTKPRISKTVLLRTAPCSNVRHAILSMRIAVIFRLALDTKSGGCPAALMGTAPVDVVYHTLFSVYPTKHAGFTAVHCKPCELCCSPRGHIACDRR